MKLGKIYQALSHGDTINLEEIGPAIAKFRQLAHDLQELGPSFKLATQECQYQEMRLVQMQDSYRYINLRAEDLK